MASNTSLDAQNIRFFINEGRCFLSGETLFPISVPKDSDDEKCLVAPFGVKVFDEKKTLSVTLSDSLLQDIEKFEGEMWEKMIQEEYFQGCKKYHSNIRKNQNGNLLNLKVTDKTVCMQFDRKRGTFTKCSTDKILPQSRLGMIVKLGSPWRYPIGREERAGISLYVDQVVIMGAGKAIAKKTHVLKDMIAQQSKKKLKFMDHIENDSN